MFHVLQTYCIRFAIVIFISTKNSQSELPFRVLGYFHCETVNSVMYHAHQFNVLRLARLVFHRNKYHEFKTNDWLIMYGYNYFLYNYMPNTKESF